MKSQYCKYHHTSLASNILGLRDEILLQHIQILAVFLMAPRTASILENFGDGAAIGAGEAAHVMCAAQGKLFLNSSG